MLATIQIKNHWWYGLLCVPLSLNWLMIFSVLSTVRVLGKLTNRILENLWCRVRWCFQVQANNTDKTHKNKGGRMYRLNIKRHFGSFQLSLLRILRENYSKTKQRDTRPDPSPLKFDKLFYQRISATSIINAEFEDPPPGWMLGNDHREG